MSLVSFSQAHSSQLTYAKASWKLMDCMAFSLPDFLGLYQFLLKAQLNLDLKWCGKSTDCKCLPSIKNRQYKSPT